jgi:hypothetical protein
MLIFTQNTNFVVKNIFSSLHYFCKKKYEKTLFALPVHVTERKLMLPPHFKFLLLFLLQISIHGMTFFERYVYTRDLVVRFRSAETPLHKLRRIAEPKERSSKVAVQHEIAPACEVGRTSSHV